MRTTGPVGGTVGVTLAPYLHKALPVVKNVDQTLAVATGNDHGLRPQLQDSPGQFLLRGLLPQARQRAGLWDVRGDNCGTWQQKLDQGRAGLLVEQLRAALGD